MEILIWNALAPIWHPQITTPTTPKFYLWHFSFDFDKIWCTSQFGADLKENEECFITLLPPRAYHPKTLTFAFGGGGGGVQG